MPRWSKQRCFARATKKRSAERTPGTLRRAVDGYISRAYIPLTGARILPICPEHISEYAYACRCIGQEDQAAAADAAGRTGKGPPAGGGAEHSFPARRAERRGQPQRGGGCPSRVARPPLGGQQDSLEHRRDRQYAFAVQLRHQGEGDQRHDLRRSALASAWVRDPDVTAARIKTTWIHSYAYHGAQQERRRKRVPHGPLSSSSGTAAQD